MLIRRMIGLSGTLVVGGALMLALPACSKEPELGPTGEVKLAPVTNPAPGVVPIDEEYKSQDATTK